MLSTRKSGRRPRARAPSVSAIYAPEIEPSVDAVIEAVNLNSTDSVRQSESGE